ncbi:T9SS type A sorting domain-containing protein [candidate division TA06 bacterium]|nr:T9SS type A sorting domain-containing protein [candidate division TA06 bacterium]
MGTGRIRICCLSACSQLRGQGSRCNVREGTTLKIYINGVLNATMSGSVAPQVSNLPLTIGQENEDCLGCDGGNNFDGLIDEVEIFDRALLASEIHAIFEAGSEGKCKTPPCEPKEPPQQRTQGYWRRQCKENPHEDICALVDSVLALSDHFDGFTCGDVCDLMNVDPPENDMCRKADRQFMALLLNVASGKLVLCNCLSDGRTVSDVIAEIESLLSGFPGHATCERAKTLADEINTGESLVSCRSQKIDVAEDDDDEEGIHFSVPNPFTIRTVIRYEIPRVERQYEGVKITGESSGAVTVRLKVFDVAGRLVKVLVDQKQEVGEYEILWDGLNGAGERVGSGIYFYRLGVGSSLRTGKIILLD